MRDFASSNGASEVKWLESNGEQKKSGGSTCLCAPGEQRNHHCKEEIQEMKRVEGR